MTVLICSGLRYPEAKLYCKYEHLFSLIRMEMRVISDSSFYQLYALIKYIISLKIIKICSPSLYLPSFIDWESIKSILQDYCTRKHIHTYKDTQTQICTGTHRDTHIHTHTQIYIGTHRHT